MDDEYPQPRDAESDLVEITTRLGEPEAVYRTGSGGVIARFVLGVVIVIVAAVLHFLLWSGEVPWPNRVRLLLLVIAGMFIGPGIGLYLITFAVRGMKLWVLQYPIGLFIWHRGRVIAFPWSEVNVIQFSGLPDKATLELEGEAFYYDLSRSGRRLFGTTLTLTRIDGEQVSLVSTLAGFPELGKRIQIETYRQLFPTHRELLERGEMLAFGEIVCDRVAITSGKQSLRWEDLDSIVRAGSELHIKRTGKKKAWAKHEISALTKVHVLFGIEALMRPPNHRNVDNA